MSEKFADPDVNRNVIDLVQNITSNQQPVYPWDILDSAESKGYEREEARRALRKLKINNYIVPTGELVGKVKLARSYDFE